MTDKLNKEQIIDLLPHRDPMLLINELKNIKKLHSGTKTYPGYNLRSLNVF